MSATWNNLNYGALMPRDKGTGNRRSDLDRSSSETCYTFHFQTRGRCTFGLQEGGRVTEQWRASSPSLTLNRVAFYPFFSAFLAFAPRRVKAMKVVRHARVCQQFRSLSVVFLVNGVFNPKQSFGKSHRYFPTCFVHITLRRAYFTLHPKKVAD